MMLLSIILFFTVLEAVHEGLASRGIKKVAAAIEFVKLMGIPALVLFWPLLVDGNIELKDYYSDSWHFWRYLFVHVIIAWLCIRYALFNPIYNLSAKLPLGYIGTVKVTDRLERWIFRNHLHLNSFLWPRFIALLLGVGLILFRL